jgi:capsular polysaccharide transport system permease protein
MTRSPVAVTLSVWKALVLRESLARLFSRRAAWFWLLVEPVVHVGFIMFLFSTVRVRHVGGFDTRIWIMVGLCAFLMFQRTARQAMGAVGSNRALFAYRQVHPVDTVLARALLEATVMVVATVLLFSGAGLFGLQVWPADPLAVLAAMLGLWLIGLGFGLVASVAEELTPEIGKLLGMLMRPLYLASGVIFPIGALPAPYRDWLMLNPIAHGIEAARLGFAPYYHAVPGVSMSYVYVMALLFVLLGLLLQVGFAKRMVMQ